MSEGDEIPKINLGRREFPIPEIPWRVTKRLMPLMSKCSKIDATNISNEVMDAIGEVMWLAVSLGSPSLKREDFENLPMKLNEMIMAIPTIIRQADLEVVETKPGEALVQPLSGQTS